MKKVFDEHENIKEKLRNEASILITELFCTMGTIAGIDGRDGGNFEFKHIADHIADNFCLDSFLRYFFVVRASWDGTPDWILTIEKILLQKMSMRYENDFESEPKKLGFVAKIISQTKTRRLREMNGNMARKTGYKVSIRDISDKKGRRMKYYFDPNCMIIRDKKLKQETSYDIEPIKNECGVNGICLYGMKSSVLRKDAFKRANEAFSKVGKNYSKMIKSKQSPATVTESTTPRKSPQFRDKNRETPRKSPRFRDKDRETSCAKKTKKKLNTKLILKKDDVKKQQVQGSDSEHDFDDVFGIIGHDESLDDITFESPDKSVNSRDKTTLKAMEAFMEELELKKKEEEKEKDKNVLATVCTIVSYIFLI